MRQRGRKSAASIETKVITGGFGQRPRPPAEVTEEEARIWEEVVAGEPTEFFATGATRGMLVDYCRHRASSDKLTRVINLFQDDWLRNADGAKRFRDLLRARESETRAAASMATKLRLTNQSRYRADTGETAARKAPRGYQPWDFE